MSAAERLADLQASADALLHAAALALEEAHEVGPDRWRASVLGGAGDAGHSDPTGDTATDPRRLALGEALEAAEAAVLDATAALNSAGQRLERAYRAWAGDPD